MPLICSERCSLRFSLRLQMGISKASMDTLEPLLRKSQIFCLKTGFKEKMYRKIEKKMQEI
jgi:hypothetical protein